MPKILEYPRSSFKNALEIAETVYSLGEKCDEETCASKLGKKISGAFSKKISASVKHDLITTNKGMLETTELFKSINNAYNDEERKNFLTQAFFKIPTYERMFKRFKGKELPIDILDKLLIREYQVQESTASVIAKYLVEGLKYLNLLSADNKVIKLVQDPESSDEFVDEKPLNNDTENDLPIPDSNISANTSSAPNQLQNNDKLNLTNKNSFQIKITGPGINTSIEICSEDDLFILDAILTKIKKSV
jgi:hypothetical protein